MKDVIKKYHVFGRAFIGFGSGLIIGDSITILISVIVGDLVFMPQLSVLTQSPVSTYTCQFLLCGLIGLTFAEAGILFFSDRWNFPIKCLLHFLCTAPVYLPFLWLCYFGQQPIPGIFIVLGNVLFTYLITWVVSYMTTKREVNAINRRIRDMRGE